MNVPYANMLRHQAEEFVRSHPGWTIGPAICYGSTSAAQHKANGVVGVYGPDPTKAKAEEAKQGRLF